MGPDLISKNYSGIVDETSASTNSVSVSGSNAASVKQNFYLPSNYKRGDYIPSLTGFELLVNAPNFKSLKSKILNDVNSIDDTITTIALNDASNWPSSGYALIDEEVFSYSGKQGNLLTGVQSGQYNTIPSFHYAQSTVSPVLGEYTVHHVLPNIDDFVLLSSGFISDIASADNGDGWVRGQFESVDIDESWLSDQFTITIHFFPNTVSAIYYNAYDSSRTGSISIGSSLYDTSPTVTNALLVYRILASVVDSDTDFLGNSYRSVVVNKSASAIDSFDKNINYWMSKPNPSEFAVENLYFNLGSTKTLDSIYLDPITPNVYFHVYYSNDPTGPGYDDASWDNLTWTCVPRSFKATKKDAHVFPEPISARYIKVEFSHLQAQYYPVGSFQKPIAYKKHPKWVLDYFLATYLFNRNKTYDVNIGSSVNVTYDALDLAFNYYKGDILQTSNGAEVIGLAGLPENNLNNIILDTSDYSNISWNTLIKIKMMFRPYQNPPSAMSKADTLIGMVVSRRSGADLSSYPVENSVAASVDTSEVSVLDREPLLLEKNFPVMFFYITCRHAYREAIAKFEDDKAYFVGINEIAFQRKVHAVASDESHYNESTSDLSNCEINDFNLDDGNWKLS